MSRQDYIQAKDKAGFEIALQNGKVSQEQIGFIEKESLIWAKGKYYPCPYTKEELEAKFISLTKLDEYLSKLEATVLYYTKEEINNLITDKITFEIVDSLPTTGELNIIYLIPSSNSQTQNVKDEYIWLSNKWEKIGSTSIDLSQYYTKTESDNRFVLKTSIVDYLTKTEASNIYQTKNDAATEKSRVDTELDKKVSNTEFETEKSRVDIELTTIKTDISNLKNKTNSLEELKATKVEVNQLRADTISMIGNISSKLKEINGI